MKLSENDIKYIYKIKKYKNKLRLLRGGSEQNRKKIINRTLELILKKQRCNEKALNNHSKELLKKYSNDTLYIKKNFDTLDKLLQELLEYSNYGHSEIENPYNFVKIKNRFNEIDNFFKITYPNEGDDNKIDCLQSLYIFIKFYIKLLTLSKKLLQNIFKTKDTNSIESKIVDISYLDEIRSDDKLYWNLKSTFYGPLDSLDLQSTHIIVDEIDPIPKTKLEKITENIINLDTPRKIYDYLIVLFDYIKGIRYDNYFEDNYFKNNEIDDNYFEENEIDDNNFEDEINFKDEILNYLKRHL